MTNETNSGLNEDQRDALQEIANIGMGQAGSSIAKIWGEFVGLSIPRIAYIDRQEIPVMLSRLVGEETVNAVRQAFHGQLRGEVVVVFSGGPNDQLADLMGYEDADSIEEQELLLDVTNILVGACLGGVAETLGVDIGFSAPSVMGLDVLPSSLIQPEELGSGRALFLEVRFTLEKKSFASHLIVMMPAEEIAVLGQSLDKFLASL
jgi:chemotaxis protein CheC